MQRNQFFEGVVAMFPRRLNHLIAPVFLAIIALAVIGVVTVPLVAKQFESVLLFRPAPIQSSNLLVPQVITTVQFPLGVGISPQSISVNPATGYIYISDYNGTTIVSGTQVVANLSIPTADNGTKFFGVNPTTGYVYIVNRDANLVTIVSATQVITTFATGWYPAAIGINPTSSYIYIVNGYGESVMVVSGTQVITTLLTATSATVRNINRIKLDPQCCTPQGGGTPFGSIGVNPTTGYVYVVNSLTNQIAVISGTNVITTLLTDMVSIAVGVNSVTGYIYVTNYQSNTVTVLAGIQIIATLDVGIDPRAVSVNLATGYVYVANSIGVTVLSGTQVITTVVTGLYPNSIGINSATGYVYVANPTNGSLTILSGTQVITTITPTGLPPINTNLTAPLGGGYGGPNVIGVNPNTGYVYVANFGGDGITVFVETQLLTSLAKRRSPIAVGVNPVSGHAYMADVNGDAVAVISGTQLITTLMAGQRPVAVDVNPVTGYIYVVNNYSNDVTVISDTQVITTLLAQWLPNAVGINPATGYVYVVSGNDNRVLVISETGVVNQVLVASVGSSIAVNQKTGYIYVPNIFNVGVTAAGKNPAGVVPHVGLAIISGTQLITEVDTIPQPVAVDVNPATGYVYVVGSGGVSITVLNGTQVIGSLLLGTASSLNQPAKPLGGGWPTYPSSIGISSKSGYIYVTDYFHNSIHVLSGLQVIATLAMSATPTIIGASPSTGYIYVAISGSNTVSVLNGTQIIGTISVGAVPMKMAFDPVRHLAYIPNYDGQSLSILQEPIVPRSITPSFLATASDDLVIDFDEPVITSTVQFVISPTLDFTVTWNGALQRAMISHTSFQSGTHYALSVLSGGVNATAIPITPISFDYVYYPYKTLLLLIFKNY
jgi:YVTN family beta-propeller protein